MRCSVPTFLPLPCTGLASSGNWHVVMACRGGCASGLIRVTCMQAVSRFLLPVGPRAPCTYVPENNKLQLLMIADFAKAEREARKIGIPKGR